MKGFSKAYDALIIGAGHNGLVAANYLAKAGKKVLVLEKRHIVGGAALTEELLPGFRFSRCSYVLSLLRPQIIKDLRLFQRGLKIHYRSINSLTPTKEVDKYLLFHMDPEKTRQEIGKWSQHDLANWDNYQRFLQAICDFWYKQVDTLPFNFIQNPGIRDKFNFLKSIIPRNMNVFETAKFITSSVEASLNDWFESDILKATLATDGIIGENISIDHPSSGYVLLHHVMGQLEQDKKGEWGYIEGGNGRLSEILCQSFLEMGGQLKVNASVNRIIYDGLRPVAVKLENGETIEAKNILSNCTNRVTFEQLVDQPEKILTKKQLNKIRSIEYNGACTKINFVLKKLPKFKAFRNINLSQKQLLRGTIHINCETLDGLKETFNQTRVNRISTRPFIDITIPSVFDKTLCPEGYFIANALMQYTPYHSNAIGLKNTEIRHSDVKQVFLDTINEYLEEPLDIHYMDILTPFDLEKMLGMTEGNIFHGAIGLDNLLFNRLSGKVGGVYICGSAAHPGGGVMGAAGKQAAENVLRNGSF